MTARDPRIDAYIAKAPKFSRPILVHLREVVHEWLADGKRRNWKHERA